MAVIKSILAYEIIDSRGYPTIEGRLTLDNGYQVVTSIPSGTSIGKYEAVDLKDNDPTRFDGQGVTRAVSYINELIAPKLVGISPLKQLEVDDWLNRADGTVNKSQLGANVLLTISQLCVLAGAVVSGLPPYLYVNKLYEAATKNTIAIERIPSPIFNIINGGKHASNSLDFQEFQIILSSSMSYSQALRLGVEMYHELKRVLQYRNASVSLGDEGGYTPNFATNIDAMEALRETIMRKNLKIGLDIFFGLDITASSFYHNGKYQIRDKQNPLKPNEFMDFISSIIENYSLLILEDPLHEDDWEGWKTLNTKISKDIYLAGDDLITANKLRMERAIKEQACTTVVIKPNQIGTVTEVLQIVDIARKNGLNCIISQRAGETNDSFIADLAVGVQSDFVKFGAPSRGERVSKYNRLWQIEREGLRKA